MDLSPNQLIGLGVIGASVLGFLLVQYGSDVWSGVAAAWSWLRASPVEEPDQEPTIGEVREDLLLLLNDAYSKFEGMKCQDGCAAIRTAISHVHQEHPHP